MLYDDDDDVPEIDHGILGEESDDIRYAAYTDLEELEMRVSQVMEAMHTNYQGQFAEQDEKLDNYEQQLAILAMAYAEAAVMIEALIGQLHFATQEEREAFNKTMKESRKHMVEVMTNNAGMETKDSDTGSPVADVDEQDDPTPTD
jgi:hypothetical protein